ncbi:acetylxylan esterase [Streptomyces olivochromogenes]|uniref:acetylxylan esterase n=1 Tax=Streptomyces olivochromogenes TaxID=1963 RepID=UPI0036942DFF
MAASKRFTDRWLSRSLRYPSRGFCFPAFLLAVGRRPFRGPAIPWHQRVDDPLQRLAPEERIALLRRYAPPVERPGAAAEGHSEDPPHTGRPTTARCRDLGRKGPYPEITKYLHRRSHHRVEATFTTLDRFDDVRFTQRAIAPALFSVRLTAPACPPSTVDAPSTTTRAAPLTRAVH